VQAVFAASDAMALGAIAAIEEAGRSGQVHVAGFDALPDALLAIQAGKMGATVHHMPHSMGRTIVEMALRAARGEAVPPLVLSDVRLITVANLLEAALETMYLLPGILHDLVESNKAQQRLHQDMIAAQRRIIQEISSPIIPISDAIIVLPLIGAIDTARSQQIIAAMLAGITRHRAQVLIIDITGVTIVDTGVAHHLLQATQAAQLLGAKVFVVGITPEVAQTIVQLDIDLSSIETCSTLQAGLQYAATYLSAPNGVAYRKR
jgi:ABC-type sugar transport system substrate-binding protein